MKKQKIRPEAPISLRLVVSEVLCKLASTISLETLWDKTVGVILVPKVSTGVLVCYVVDFVYELILTSESSQGRGFGERGRGVKTRTEGPVYRGLGCNS